MRCLLKSTVAWLIAWLLAVPLIHVHPEADHRHGLPGHIHGGTFHAVFSPELPCATAPAPAPDDEGPVLTAAGSRGMPPFNPGAHLGDHPTIAFSLLATKADGIILQLVEPANPADRDRSLLPLLAEAPAEVVPLSLRSAPYGSASPRAPPALLPA